MRRRRTLFDLLMQDCCPPLLPWRYKNNAVWRCPECGQPWELVAREWTRVIL